MTSDNGRAGGGSERRDEVWPGFVHWELGLGGHGGEMVWRCDALRAGRLYNRRLFGSRQEAESFAGKMREVEPDQVFNVEAMKASAVWN